MINARPWGEKEEDDWGLHWVFTALFLMLKGIWVVVILFYVSELFYDRKTIVEPLKMFKRRDGEWIGGSQGSTEF